MNYEFHCGNSKGMTAVEEGSVHLIVTSPPYYDAISYDRHAAGQEYWYRDCGEALTYLDYRNNLKQVWGECWRVLAPGRVLAIVVGDLISQGARIPLPAHLVGDLESKGFEYAETITWNKATGGVKRAGSVISKPYPGYYYPNIMTESILLFRKPHPDPAYRVFKHRLAVERNESRISIDDVFKRDTANNLWTIAPVPPNTLPHPCPFPEEIPFRLIQLYTYIGERVLDPFCGIGTTVKCARWLGRHGIGYDTQQGYLDEAERRIDQPLNLRKQQLVARYDKVDYQPGVPNAGLQEESCLSNSLPINNPISSPTRIPTDQSSEPSVEVILDSKIPEAGALLPWPAPKSKKSKKQLVPR